MRSKSNNNTNEVVAIYKGDPIGAAAAIVCMQYECSRFGRCHDLYHNIWYVCALSIRNM